MGFVKKIKSSEEYAGESFTVTVTRKVGNWVSGDSGVWELYKVGEPEIVLSGELTLVEDHLVCVVPKEDTINLDGDYKLLLYHTTDTNPHIKDVMVEYQLKYTKPWEN